MKTCVALGFFDGVHLGHRELIKKTVAEARSRGAVPMVYTFSSHPSHILTPDRSVECIYTENQKFDIITSLGIEKIVFENFEKVKDLTPLEFVEDVLVHTLDAECVICGYNFRFGKGNVGDIDTLSSLLPCFGIKLFVIPPVCAADEPVSSGRIRALIQKGDIENTNLCLVSPYYIQGRVVHGKHIGHSLGFPTANVEFPSKILIPLHGVYYTKTICHDKEYLSLTNVGIRPTVGDGKSIPVSETYLIGFDGVVYGEEIKVSFYSFARPEIRFSSLDELSCALNKDVEKCLEFFKNEDKK